LDFSHLLAELIINVPPAQLHKIDAVYSQQQSTQQSWIFNDASGVNIFPSLWYIQLPATTTTTTTTTIQQMTFQEISAELLAKYVIILLAKQKRKASIPCGRHQ
jgi:hypothetical protein